MSTRIIILLWILFSVLTAELPSQTVKFVKSIHFKRGGEKNAIASFLLGKRKEEKIKPSSICRIKPGVLCVTDTINGWIVILNNEGIIQKKIGSIKGSKIQSPVSACADDLGNLYISDSTNRRVLKFDKNFRFANMFITEPDIRITGIVFISGKFFCVDTRNHQIICYNRRGTRNFTFGRRGSGPGEFNFPTHITADNDYIYITDSMNFRVQILNHQGNFIRCFGSAGRGGGNFSKPKGLAVNREKQIFVADAMFDNIQIFGFKGEFLYYFGGPGHGTMGFWMPLDIMIDRDNLIWVADTYNNRIQVFKIQKEDQ